MENNEISIHEVKIFLQLKAKQEWLSNIEISKLTGIPRRTVAFKTKKFVDLGILDMAEVYPGHRFKLSSLMEKRNKAYTNRLESAANVFGLTK